MMPSRQDELDEMTRWAQEAADEAKAAFDWFGIRIVRVEDPAQPSFLDDDFIAEGKAGAEARQGPFCVDAVEAYIEQTPTATAVPPRRMLSKPKNPLTGTPKPVNPRKRRT